MFLPRLLAALNKISLSTSNQIQTISCNIRLRATRIEGMSSVVLLVIVDRVSDRIPVGITWPTIKFDKVAGRLMPRFPNDRECVEHNLVIERFLAVANKLKLQCYAYDQPITIKEFKYTFVNFSSRESVIEYMEHKVHFLFRQNLISQQTKKNNVSIINTLKSYPPSKEWNFSSVTGSDLKMYEVWLRQKGKIRKTEGKGAERIGMAHNTIVGHFKVLKKYYSLAKEDKIPLNNPFENFNIKSYEPGMREVIDKNELAMLYKFRSDGDLTEHERNCLDRYLIGCFTGLRKSDIENLNPRKQINDGILNLRPQKTLNFGTVVKFPLPKPALEILADYPDSGFSFIEDSLLNKTLKKVIAKSGLNKYIKFHSSRDCFAVLYLKFGGNLGDLKDILGHKKISTTEIYLKMGSDAKADTMSLFNDI